MLCLLPCRLPLCLSAPSAVLPLRRAGLPPPFCAIYKDARRRPRPCRPAYCCRLLPPAAAAAVLLSASPFGLLLHTAQIRTYLRNDAPRKTGRRD